MLWANLLGSLTLGAVVTAQEPPPTPPVSKPKVRVGRPVVADQKDTDKGPPQEGAKAGAKGGKPVLTTPPKPGEQPVVRIKSKYIPNLVIPRARPRAQTTPSYRISIRMPGGRRFTGVIVRDPAFHKVVFEGGHHRPEAYLSSRSLKLSFVDGLDGEVDLRWNQLVRVEVRDVVSDREILAMQKASELARIEEARRARAKHEAGEAEGDVTEEEATDPSAESDAEDQADDDRPEILLQFPPEEGWSAERKRQIEWRRTVVGTFPDEEEQAFLDAYDEWAAAEKAWTAEQVQKMEEERSQLDKKQKQLDELEKRVLRDGAGPKRGSGGGAPPAKGSPPPGDG